MIPYGRQSISDADVDSVVAILRSDFLTQGPAIEQFEQAMALTCGSQYAVAVCNATAALHIACQTAGLGPGDRLWTSPNTFVASANCALYLGAKVDFVDIDPQTYNMCPIALRTKLVAAKASGTLPKVVIPVHFAGQSCRMEQISSLAKEFGFIVIEDASHAVGASYQGSPVGSGRYSDMTVFSFHPVKIITTGEGGMILTNREDFQDRLRRLRSHGITRDPAHMEGESHGPWYYQQIELGYNHRMTDIQAALGECQLKRLTEFIERRHVLASRYDTLLAALPLILPYQDPNGYSALHLYPIQVRPDSRVSRRQLFDGMRAAGIAVNVHYIPVHTQPHYRRLGFENGDFPIAENYYSGAISLPMYAGLSDAEQDKVVSVMRKLLE